MRPRRSRLCGRSGAHLTLSSPLRVEELNAAYRQPKLAAGTRTVTGPGSAGAGSALAQADGLDQRHYAAVEELLSAPVIRRLMKRDGVGPESIRRLIDRIARQTRKPE